MAKTYIPIDPKYLSAPIICGKCLLTFPVQCELRCKGGKCDIISTCPSCNSTDTVQLGRYQ